MEGLAFPGHIWPEIDSVQSAMQIVAKADHHTIVVMEGKVPVILISLFGEIGALIPLGEPIVCRCQTFKSFAIRALRWFLSTSILSVPQLVPRHTLPTPPSEWASRVRICNEVFDLK
jgi:hypothetical protein